MAARNPSVPQTSKTLEELKELLESKLSNWKTLLHHLRGTEANNPIDRLPRQELEPYKKLLIRTLIGRLTPQPPDVHRSEELLHKAVLEKLEMQFQETTRMIGSENRVLNELNEKLKSLQEQCVSFDNIMSTRLEWGEMKLAENYDKIEKHLKADFKKYRKMLVNVFNTSYLRDQDMKRLMENLLQSSFDNKTEYIDLSSEEDLYRLTRFLQIGLVFQHPVFPLKVRLGEGQ